MHEILLSEYFRGHPAKSRRLKQATGCLCENCGSQLSSPDLEIHLIGNPKRIGTASPDIQKHILVLCPSCRRSFLSGRVEESLQRELVRHRSREVRNRMREVLGYHPPKYVPPDTYDPEAGFREIFDSGALDLCLNGG